MENFLLDTVIIDDEVVAILDLIDMLNVYSSINIVGTATNLDEGIELIRITHPNIVFLDIDMPYKSGSEIFNEFEDPYFKIIFTTSKNQKTLRNLMQHSCEYLSKPLDRDKLNESLNHVFQAFISEKNIHKQVNSIFHKYI